MMLTTMSTREDLGETGAFNRRNESEHDTPNVNSSDAIGQRSLRI
jgi:hypothetical protein